MLGQEHAWDVVTVEGRLFPAALQLPLSRLQLVAQHGDALRVIPHQIDERDSSGRIALPRGVEPSQDESPGVFDDNDLLVFATSDLGERARIAGAAEIQVTSPLDGATGWAYLRVGGDTPAVFPHAVHYDPEFDMVFGPRYVLGFGRHTSSYFAFVHPDGTLGRNLLDRVKVRITVTLLGGLLTFHRTEQDITSTVVAWKEGPIRVIRRARIRTRIGYGLPQPEVMADNIFTDDTFESPSTVRIPFDLRYVLGNLELRSFMDFDDLRNGRVFTREHAPVPIGCDLPQPPVNGVETNWFGLTGPEGTFVQDLLLSPDLRTVKVQLYAVADPAPDPPERVPGNCPGLGYTLTHWQGIGRGDYWSDTIVHAFAQYESTEVQNFLFRLEHPVGVTVNPGHTL
jgi:hypothetical protein